MAILEVVGEALLESTFFDNLSRIYRFGCYGAVDWWREVILLLSVLLYDHSDSCEATTTHNHSRAALRVRERS